MAAVVPIAVPIIKRVNGIIATIKIIKGMERKTFIIIFKILLNEKNFRLMMKEIEYEIELLDGKVDTIEIDRVLDRMGFPEDYMNIIGR